MTPTSTPTATPTPKDTDGDGIPDTQDPRPLQFDPTGFLYDEADGRIVPGGIVTVSGPGPVIVQNGSNGAYAFNITVAGTYTLTVTPPPGYQFSNTCLRHDPPPFNPAGLGNPVVLGSFENGGTGFLTSSTCTTFYLSFNLVPLPGDPVIINNNIPLRRVPQPPVAIPVFPSWALVGGLIAVCLGVGLLALRRVHTAVSPGARRPTGA